MPSESETLISKKGRLIKALKADPTNDESGKFLLVAVIADSEAAEAILTRVSLVKNSCVALVYAHRFYGDERSEDLITWFETNGFRMEKEIIDFQSVPSESVILDASE